MRVSCHFVSDNEVRYSILERSKNLVLQEMDCELAMDKNIPTFNPLLLHSRRNTATASPYHVRLGHPGADIFNRIAPIVELPKPNIDDYTVCPACELKVN